VIGCGNDGATTMESGMSVPHWSPSATVSAREQWLLKRLVRTKKLFAFLRLHRHELFDEVFQLELADMYRDSGEGKQPVAPALWRQHRRCAVESSLEDGDQQSRCGLGRTIVAERVHQLPVPRDL
jgi:hypothetical protein